MQALQMVTMDGESPLLARRGGCAHKEKSREATSAVQTGWWFNFDKSSNWNNHPVRSINRCFAIFLDLAATPPGQEGRCHAQTTAARKRKLRSYSPEAE